MKAYKFRISLKHIQPSVWRRFTVPTGMTLAELACIFNVVMGWDGVQSYGFSMKPDFDFIVGGEKFCGIDGKSVTPEKEIADRYIEKLHSFEYVYDLDGGWKHNVRLEAVVTDYEKNYPTVIKFKGDCPPEDAGGADGYMTLLLGGGGNDAALKDCAPYDVDSVNAFLAENCQTSAHDSGKKTIRFVGKNSPSVVEFPHSLRDIGTGFDDNFERVWQNAFDETISKTKDFRNMTLEEQQLTKTILRDFAYDVALAGLSGGEDRFHDLDSRRFMAMMRMRSFDLVDYLNTCCIKNDLVAIAVQKNIKLSRSAKKSVLAESLANEMMKPDVLIPYILWSTPEEMNTILAMGHVSGCYDINDETDDLPVTFIDGGYLFAAPDEAWVAPHDFLLLTEKLYDDALQEKHYRCVWLQDCINAALILYGAVPVHILETLVCLNPKYRMSGEAILAELESRPADIERLLLKDGMIYAEEDEEFVGELFAQKNELPYYIPTLPMLESGKLTPPPSDIIAEKMHGFLMYEQKLDDETAYEIAWEFYDMLARGADTGELTDCVITKKRQRNLPRFQKMLAEMEPFVRKIKNHGFTDNEMKKLKEKNIKRGAKVVPIDSKKKGGI